MRKNCQGAMWLNNYRLKKLVCTYMKIIYTCFILDDCVAEILGK